MPLWKRKKLALGKASQESRLKIRVLQFQRKKRQMCFTPLFFAAEGGLIGIVISLPKLNPPKPLSFAIGTLIGYGIGKAAVFSFWAEDIRNCTTAVGQALGKEAKKNKELRDFLGETKYVFIDKKGNLIATNRKRFFGVGRLRLETKKILAGEY